MAPPIVLITGANSGIGYVTARALATADESYHVIMTGRDLAKVESAAAEIKEQKGLPENQITTLELEVTSQSSIDKAVAAVQEKFGYLDVLINNAGIAPTGPDLETMYRTTFETNVIGSVLVAAAFRPLLMASASPQLLYMSTVVSSLNLITDDSSPMRTTHAGSTAYRASKAALNMVAMHEQLEMKDTKLKVRALCPGFVVSNIRGKSEEERTAGGLAGDPETSASLILSILRGERDGEERRLIGGEVAYEW